MSKYEREAIGHIVIIRNIIFKNTLSNKKEVDHSWEQGRPCIIIHSDDEYDYFLTMKSNPDYENHEPQYIPINNDDLLDRVINRYDKHNNMRSRRKEITGAVNLENIYRIPISGHDEVGKLTFDAYKNITKKIKEYHKTEDIKIIIERAETIRGR